jgi:hypothetical protein
VSKSKIREGLDYTPKKSGFGRKPDFFNSQYVFARRALALPDEAIPS